MDQILLIGNNTSFDTLYSLNITSYLGLRVLHKKSHNEAFELLTVNKDIKLIITQKDIDFTKTAIEVYKYLKEEQLNIPLIVLGAESLLEKHATILPENPDVAELVRNCAHILGITAKDVINKTTENYIAIPIEFFLLMETLICPVYIRIKNPEGDQFIKRFNERESVFFEDAENYIKKGLRELYIPKEYRLVLASSVTKEMLTKLKSDSLSDNSRITVTSNCVDVLREQMRTAGMNVETVELARSTLASVQKVISKSSKVTDLLENVMNNKASYRYRMIQLVSMISFHALSNMEWGTAEQQEKLAFVALLHDISLASDDLARIRNIDDFGVANHLGVQDKKLVQNHANESAAMVENFPTAPIGIEMIIKQHHCSLTGAGFPKSFSNNISPLAIVFFVCEEYAHGVINLYKKLHGGVHEQVLEDMKSKYTKFIYKRVLNTLENLQLF
ncbi:MAG: hypothetical protein HQK53_06840 [Oligoflexia bacterium]|nr:hypothetical protein [Oligoflexia bacterium]